MGSFDETDVELSDARFGARSKENNQPSSSSSCADDDNCSLDHDDGGSSCDEGDDLLRVRGGGRLSARRRSGGAGFRLSTREGMLRQFRRASSFARPGLRETETLWSQSAWTIKEAAGYSGTTLCAVVIAHALGMGGGWAFPDGCHPTCDPNDRTRNSHMCDLMKVLDDGLTSFHLLVSFILGGFLLTTRGLWMVRRTAYCALCGATRNLVISLTTIAPPGERRALARWAVLGYELSVLKGRNLVDTDEARDFLRQAGLIVEDEWERMVNGDRHSSVWFWIQSKARILRDRGDIESLDFQTICNAVTLSRDKANDLMSCIDRDQPPPYVFVCGILVNINLRFRAAAQGAKWAVWINDAPGLLIWKEPRFYASIVVLLLYTTIFAMLFDVCAVLHNPFGPRDIDVPHSVVGRGIRFLAHSLSRPEEECHPSTMGLRDGRDSDLSEISDTALRALRGLEERMESYRGATLLSLGRATIRPDRRAPKSSKLVKIV